MIIIIYSVFIIISIMIIIIILSDTSVSVQKFTHITRTLGVGKGQLAFYLY